MSRLGIMECAKADVKEPEKQHEMLAEEEPGDVASTRDHVRRNEHPCQLRNPPWGRDDWSPWRCVILEIPRGLGSCPAADGSLTLGDHPETTFFSDDRRRGRSFSRRSGL
jgi:hypothetical protein